MSARLAHIRLNISMSVQSAPFAITRPLFHFPHGVDIQRNARAAVPADHAALPLAFAFTSILGAERHDHAKKAGPRIHTPSLIGRGAGLLHLDLLIYRCTPRHARCRPGWIRLASPRKVYLAKAASGAAPSSRKRAQLGRYSRLQHQPDCPLPLGPHVLPGLTHHCGTRAVPHRHHTVSTVACVHAMTTMQTGDDRVLSGVEPVMRDRQADGASASKR